MTSPILINSGAYIGDEMQAEFGRIPPVFLPVGPTYLLKHQLQRFGIDRDVWLSLPVDFELEESQVRNLDEAGVRVIRIDPEKSLGMSVFQSIVEIGIGEPIEIIHGDTLIERPARGLPDTISVAQVSEQYVWGKVELAGSRVASLKSGGVGDPIADEAVVLSGYFSIGNTQFFLRCLSRADFDFVQALDLYASHVGLSAIVDLAALDFGHLKTFYSSRYKVAAARHFNDLEIDAYTVTKRSQDHAKIDAEAHWLRSIPSSLQPYAARLIEDGEPRNSGVYRTLYANFPTAAELFLARAPRFVWNKILASCEEYLTRASVVRLADHVAPFRWLTIDKLRERIADYPKELPRPDADLVINGLPIGALEDIIERLVAILDRAEQRPACVMHGDFCFSNMLFDMRSERIMLIDPRGTVRGQATIYGDIRYDVAKLGHSIIGRYDQIIAGQLVAQRSGAGEFLFDPPPDARYLWLESEFLARQVDGISFASPQIMATIVSLFLSMIPLHSDDPGRQQTLFANALRLMATRPEIAAAP